MSFGSMVGHRIVDAGEHIEFGQAHVAAMSGSGPHQASGDDEAEVARMLHLMQELLDGFRAQRDGAPASGRA